MEIQQTHAYASFIRSLGWHAEHIGTSWVYIKTFPLIGGIAKLQRSLTLPTMTELLPVLRKYHVTTLAAEPDYRIRTGVYNAWLRRVRSHVRINTDYFLPTKTIRVSLSGAEADIFGRFSEAKRRAVRRAEKNGITVTVSRDIDTFLALKAKSAGFLGFITVAGMKKLWNALPPAKTSVLMAYRPGKAKPVAGIFLVIQDRICYYWLAGSLPEGKKLFAPTKLVWEALREGKRLKCRDLDFVGVWDERMPNMNRQWLGFTRFKEGFGGQPLYYPLVPPR